MTTQQIYYKLIAMKKLPCITALLCVCLTLCAQSLDQAKKLYDAGLYAEAKPAFERLLTQAPANASYNHWYGVCCYETGDMANAEKYLVIGVKRKVQESCRYLAEVYYQTYQFDKAAGMYEEYISLLVKKKQDTEAFRERQAKAANAQRMLEKVENVQVIDSLTADKSDFLNAYALSGESGMLAPFRDFFQTDDSLLSTVYMTQRGDKIFYARPADGNRLSLFCQSKLLDKWDDEKQLPANVNSPEADNINPFVLSDGVTLYYASDGSNSLGGYDLFVSRYNTNSENYLTPEQLGMPYNSIYNDYMIVFDEAKHLGWFVSDRYQPEDSVCVYLFIINGERTRVDSDDLNVKRAYAALSSISDTWQEGTDYTSLIALAHEAMPSGKAEIRKDFEFIINNTLTYYTYADINSPEAANLYRKAVALTRQIKELTDRLDSLRTEYTAGNADKRLRLRPSILQAEDYLNTLLSQPAQLEKQARNAEITCLRAQKKQ
ncbi:putative methyltransferase (contains TPR repeat) [Bacteroidales bacterium Barb7]|nr:putative methyltransferase (contains TPR repeat) [Bacteroidales bacterium Barb7]